MARKPRQLDPAIEALVIERLRPDECIHSWLPLRKDGVLVRLIDRELHEFIQSWPRKPSRVGGFGRNLVFRLQEGRWVFMSEGGWIS